MITILDETLEVLYEDFLDWKLAHWHDNKQEWANITFVQWISELIYVDEVIKLSTQEEYQ